jgi:hypothetical protein
MSTDQSPFDYTHTVYQSSKVDEFPSLDFLTHTSINSCVFFVKEKIVNHLNLTRLNLEQSIEINPQTLKQTINELTFELDDINKKLESHFREVSEIEKKYPATKPINPVMRKRYWELIKTPMDDLVTARHALINLGDLLTSLTKLDESYHYDF